jgi:hypothetical protein
MTAKEPMWGTGTSTPDGYALRDSEVVLRLLLPAQVTGVADRVPWRQVARAFGDVTRVDGYTSWVELTELSGQGGTAPPQGYRPPAGYLDTDTYTLLLEVSLRALGDTPWTAVGASGWSTSGAPLTSPPWGLDDNFSEFSKTVSGSLVEVSASWTSHGFSGRAWTTDGRAGIAAPSYADSLVISGPGAFADALLATGLEVFPVDRHRQISIWAD